MTGQSNRPISIHRFLIPLAFSVVLTMYLFYIDEGYYDFRWMLQWGNWIACIIYVSVIAGLLILFNQLLWRSKQSLAAVSMKSLLSTFILIVLAMMLFHK
ncbi:MAG: hypothetical protein JNJ58_05050 [Chitinophagaceae bacterium]|nr:hypothetical protein [Chitinophagaceae bacterium]